MVHLLVFLGGAVAGLVAASIIYLIKRASGTLKIDHSNPEKDIYRIEIDDLDALSKKNRVVLKIDNAADLSHK